MGDRLLETPTTSEHAITVRDLTIRVGPRDLLRRAGFRVPWGELCLLVGASGTGKSLTLALLSGLLELSGAVHVEGEVRVLGHDPLRRRAAGIPGTGILFQDFALFDDLDAAGNVRFALDHGSRSEKGGEEEVRGLLEEFHLRPDAIPALMSGGMRQRLALARVLAFRPRLIFHDEPTSGLDPAMSKRVAQRIRQVHDEHGMTTLVVTHDLSSLLGIADRVIFLNPEELAFRDVPLSKVDETLAALEGFQPSDESGPAPRGTPAERVVRFLESAGDFVLGAIATLASLVPRFPRRRWGRHFLWYDFRLTTFGTAIPFLGLAGLITGFITTWFMFSLLPVRGYTEPVLIEEFLGSLGFALYRVAVPTITSLLFASRAGAAVAADVGNRRLQRQTEALRSFGVDPGRYLFTSITLASLVGIPLLFLVAALMAYLTSVGVFLATHPGHGTFAFRELFFEMLEGPGPLPRGTAFVLGKLLLSALGTAGIAWHIGIRPKRSGAEVARGVTDTIIRATVFVLIVHLIFAFIEF